MCMINIYNNRIINKLKLNYISNYLRVLFNKLGINNLSFYKANLFDFEIFASNHD